MRILKIKKIKTLVEKTSFVAVFGPQYVAILALSISDSSRWYILNDAVYHQHITYIGCDSAKNAAQKDTICCGSGGTGAYSVFFFKFKKHTICCGLKFIKLRI